MMPLIVLRPEPGASTTVARAEMMGLAVRRHPLFTARTLDWSPPPADQFDALLVTSAQTARLAGPALDRYDALPIYAVGEPTAAALRSQGFSDIVAGSTDGTAIAARMAADGHRVILHLAGETVATIEPGPLTINRVAVYTMVETKVGDPLLADIAEGAIILVHSPRAGARLAQLVPPALRAMSHVIAISPAALDASGEGWTSGAAAETPLDDRVLALAARLCESLRDRAGKRAT